MSFPSNHLSHDDLSSHLHHHHHHNQFPHQPPPPPPPAHEPSHTTGASSAPNWLNAALLHNPTANFLDLHNSSTHSSASGVMTGVIAPPHDPAEAGRREDDGVAALDDWREAKHKAEILAHPLYEQLLSAHVACLRIATPVDQLPRIDLQLAQSAQVVAKYSALGGAAGHDGVADDKELDQFMVISLKEIYKCSDNYNFLIFFFCLTIFSKANLVAVSLVEPALPTFQYRKL